MKPGVADLLKINMGRKLRIIYKYLIYRLKAKTKYGIHSPFVFDLITKVIEDKTNYVSYNRVEEQRSKLLKNKNLIEIVDFGSASGKSGYTTSLEQVRHITKRSSILPSQGQLLHRIVRYFKPDIILEMGTSLGISSIYQVSAAPESFFIGIEGCATTAAIAEQNLSKFSDNNSYSIVIGNFSKLLPTVLSKIEKLDFAFIDGNHAYSPTMEYFSKLLPYFHEDSVLIIHDINYSKGMEAAWKEIKGSKQVTFTIDLFHMGLVFFRSGMPKQDFIIRY